MVALPEAVSAGADNPYLGIGLYTIPEAARLLRTTPDRARRWARGYTFRRQGEPRFSPPLFQRDQPTVAGGNILTFRDLVEIKLIELLRSQNISLHKIRRIAEFIATHYGVSHPLAFQRFHRDGVRIYGEWAASAEKPEIRQERLQELPTFQLVLTDIARPFLKELDYDEGLASRLWPLGREKRVVLDPHRSFGQPIDDPTGVPTSVLSTMVSGGTPREQVAEWYEVPLAAVEDACEFEQWLLAA